MKDYRLSEIQNGYWRDDDITKRRGEYEFLCELQYDLEDEDIEPRDMIELPCKEHRKTEYVDVWDVYYRNESYDGFIDHDCFASEAEADKFFEWVKGNKK